MDGYLKDQIKKGAKNIGILWLIIAVVFALFAFMSLGFNPSNIKNEPKKVSSYSGLHSGDYVDFGETQVYWASYSRQENNKDTAYYGYIETDDGYIVVAVPVQNEIATNDTSIGRVYGVVKSFETYEKQLPQLITDEAGASEYVIYFSDKYLINVGSTNSGQVVIFYLLAAAALVFLILFVLKIATSSNYRRAKSYKRLAERENPEVAETHINQAVAEGQYAPLTNALPNVGIVTDDYIVVSPGHGGCIERKENLVWAYPSIVTTRYMGVVKMGQQVSVMFLFKDKKSNANVAVRKEEISREIMQTLSQYCPNTLLGYNPEYKKMYDKDPVGFANWVIQSKQQAQEAYAAQQQATAEAAQTLYGAAVTDAPSTDGAPPTV
ncbi:MAG: hypothetical protein LBQ95_07135 [Lachnospiraceae bacterium]|jgi:flagellar basal body-associated protein FliL|nr:hypothetical protein [Lachnospiraceae bacterium]